MQKAIALLFVLLAAPAFAVGTDDEDTPPQPTETTTQCRNDEIYDPATKSCTTSEEQSFNDDQRYDAVRELAYAGEYDRALRVIETAQNPDDPRFLNYHGFIQRKLGKMDKALLFYRAALRANPDYHLARSYMGMGLVQDGDIGGAKAQLAEIAARGGEGGWPFRALEAAIEDRQPDY